MRVLVNLKESFEDVKIIIEKLDRKPPELPEPLGLVWAYHQIDVNVPEEVIENAEINFWVLKEWLKAQGVREEDVMLLRYYPGEWENLSTWIIGENVTHIRYTASTSGFSIFAITATVAALPPEKPFPITPLICGIIAVIAIIAGILVYKRKRV